MFLDKRDKKGQLLSFGSFSLSKKIAEIALRSFLSSKYFVELSKVFPKDLTILLFKKIIYENIYETSSKILIAEYNGYKTIKTDFFSLKVLKKKFKSKFLFKKKINFLNFEFIKEKISENFWLNLPIINFLSDTLLKKKIPKKTNKFKIAVNYLDGYNLNERSDFFWYNKKYFSNKVIAYFENDERLIKYNNKKEVIKSKLNFLKIDLKNLYSLENFSGNFQLDKLRQRIKNIKPLTKEDLFYKKHSLITISKVQYVSNFFKNNNVKIHFNSEEMSSSNIIRQIAIKLNDGCSFGRIKSYPTNITGDFIGFYPNDIFFAWGKETAKRILKTENNIKNIVISGDPYPSISKNKRKSIIKKINILKKNNIKFFILILDSSYSANKSFTWQLIYKEKIELFFNKIFELMSINPHLGVIIKSKKKDNLRSLDRVFKNIKRLENENKCIFINNNNDLAHHYAEFSDLALSISPHIQGALFQCLISSEKLRGVIYDDSNLSFIEKEIYKFGKNKVIFRDLEKMIDEIKKYVDQPKKNFKFGKWPNLHEHDPFRDGLGGKRVGWFLKNLLNNYEKGLNTELAIIKTINRYKKEYNSDKIYEKK